MYIYIIYIYIMYIYIYITDVVMCVAAHPFKTVLASGSLEKDKSIKIWEMI